MDISTESQDITADLIEQTPIEKCSLNPRRGRNSRRLLTGFIIYASEVRKEVVEKYPDENFGFISKLVGDKWRELNQDARFKYHQRALIHNKRIKELAAREGVSLGDIDLANGSVIKAPKPKTSRLQDSGQKPLSSKKSKKAIKEAKLRQSQSISTPTTTTAATTTTTSASSAGPKLDSLNSDTSSGGHERQQQVTTATPHKVPTKIKTADSATQTPSITYIQPPPKKMLKFSPAFLKRLAEIRGITI